MRSSVFMEDALRTMALRNIKSFYIEYFVRENDIALNEAATMLHEFSKVSDRLKIKYELRCCNCINILDEFDNLIDIKKNAQIECEECGYENIITSDNIYIIYYISEEYRKEIISISRQKKSARSRRLRKKEVITPSSINGLEEKGAFKVFDKRDGYKIEYCTINVYNSYENYGGNVGAMGNESRAEHFNFYNNREDN